MNNVSLIGRLTKDPEEKRTSNDKAVCTFTLAVDRQFGDETDFIPIVTWGKLAEICGTYLVKGKQVGVTGEIRTRSYETQDGQKRFVTEVNAQTMQMLGKKEDGPGGKKTAAPAGYEGEQKNFEEIDMNDFPF